LFVAGLARIPQFFPGRWTKRVHEGCIRVTPSIRR
jgi:hypothetical protein